MKTYHKSVTEMWDRFTEINPEYKNCKYGAWYFDNNKKSADALAELVKDGIKRATTSLLYWYEKGDETIPAADDINIVTDYEGTAKCIIKTHRVTVLPFHKVSAEMAATEGEGDKSLEYWRRVHISFFTEDLINESIDFSEDTNVVFEEFEMIYK